MEGRKRSRALSRTVYSAQKRLLAFLLAMAMILTNVGADMNTALAASSSESVTFTMSGSQLVKAIDEAIADGNEVTAEDLDFTNGKIAEFEKLFFGEGKIYEVFPDPEGGSMDAELRVFVRLPEDADDMYMVTGDEEIIFLYVNNGEDTISCTTEITRMDDGVEKVKKTKRVTVKSYEAAYGDEEVNHISKPAETPAPAPEDTNGPGAQETTAPSETESQVETTAPAADETTVADDTTEAPDETTSDETTTPDETQETDETQAALPEDTTEAPAESETEASTEEPATTEAAEEKTQEATEPEKTEAPETEAPEPEATEPVASIIRHYAPVVADNENNDGADAAEVKEETEAPEPEKEEEPKETEAPTKEDATEAEQTEATEAPSKEESTEADQPTDPTDSTQASEDETTTAADGETTVPDTDETTAAPVESSTADESEGKAETPTQKVPDVASSSEAKPTQAPEKEDNVSAAGSTDLVGIGYCSTAKIYVTTINQLKALDDFEGYKISYAIYPEASARIVEGPRGVEEGQALTFGVKNQIGYAVENVTANGEILSVDSVADNDDTTQTVWYSVPDIYEEQIIEVYMTETGEHPEFADSVTINGVTITATAPEGVIPIGTRLDVKEVTTEIEAAVKDKLEYEEGSQVSSVLAYDINLMLNGVKLDNSWSDNGYVTVSFSGKRILEETSQGNVVEIFAADDVNEEQLSADTAAAATAETLTLESVSDTVIVPEGTGVNQVSFDAEHFTIYIITNITDKPTHTYNFYNGDELINTQIVKDGDTLVEPQIPSSESNQFLGWSTDSIPDEYQVFGSIGVTNTQTIDLHARFTQTYYVYFNNNGVIRQIKQANTGQSVNVMDVDIEVAGDEALTGWTLSEGSTESVGDSVTIANSDINLYPIIQKVKWITYYANGGSYTAPTYVGIGQIPEAPENPMRLGYSFGGWYTDAALTKAFGFDTAINTDIELYAKWTGLSGIKYTVIHWKENADDNEYSFWDSQELTGRAGATTNAKSKSASGFNVQTITQKEIAGDGSTIVNVYYNRIVYKVVFKQYKRSGWGGSWNEISSLTISAKYGANIKSQWPDSNQYPMWGTTYQGSSANGPYQSGIDVMPLNGATFYFYESSGSYTYKMNYYLEVLDGESGISGYNKRIYNLDHTDTFKASNTNWTTTEEDRYEIKGFTYSKNINDNRSFEKIDKYNYKLDFYYYRNDYNINFVNGGKVVKSISEQYEADISKVSYEPAKPSGVPDVYEFVGWYDNEQCQGKAYSFVGKTMPAMDITLYAKWAAPQFEITFDVNGGTGSYPNQIVDYGKTVLQPGDNPTRDGYTFAGWTHNDTVFNFNTEIYANTDLVAKWISTHKLTVIYDAGEGAGVIPVDTNQYVDGSSAAAKPGDTLTHPENKGFIGWKLGENVYYPGETFVVDSSLAANDQVTLVAQWDRLPGKVFLTYHANFGGDETETTASVINNGTVTIVDGNELFEREGYVFEKWTTNQNGTGDAYNAGDTALLDNVGSNDLYAQWIKCKEITITAASESFPYDGTAHSNSNVTVTEGSLATGDRLVAEAAGSVTNVLDTVSGNNVVQNGYKIMNGNVNVSRNYKITPQNGTLSVIPKEVTITAASENFSYDGKPHSNSGYEVTGMIGTDAISAVVEGSITYPDQSPVENKVVSHTFTSGEKSNYRVEYVDGSLTMEYGEQ
ncbi:InlB B-repeat-containing protein, partial [Enterocloster citroniae]